MATALADACRRRNVTHAPFCYCRYDCCLLVVCWSLMLGPYPLVLPVAAARSLQQDPATYVSIKGQQPGGFYAVGDKAEASAAASSRGIRYNNGRVIIAGDGYPGARSSSTTGDAAARSAPTPSDANTNLGIQTIASQGLWARAVAGSGVGFTGASKSPNALTNNIASFKPNNQHSKDTSTAFTEITAESSAVSGAGNGPAAMSWGYETGAAARAARSTPEPLQHGERWSAGRRNLKSLKHILSLSL